MFNFTFSPEPTIEECMDYILGLLRHNLEQDVETGKLRFGFAMLIYTPFTRLATRIMALLARAPITIKRVPPSRTSKLQEPQEPDAPKPQPEPPPEPQLWPFREPVRLTFKHDWVRRALEKQNSFAAAQPTTLLGMLLRDPLVVARFAIDPRLAQAMRALCHMLGVPTPQLIRLPERPHPVWQYTPPSPKPRKPRAPRYHASLFEDLRTPPECVDHTWRPNRTTPWRK